MARKQEDPPGEELTEEERARRHERDRKRIYRASRKTKAKKKEDNRRRQLEFSARKKASAYGAKAKIMNQNNHQMPGTPPSTNRVPMANGSPFFNVETPSRNHPALAVLSRSSRSSNRLARATPVHQLTPGEQQVALQALANLQQEAVFRRLDFHDHSLLHQEHNEMSRQRVGATIGVLRASGIEIESLDDEDDSFDAEEIVFPEEEIDCMPPRSPVVEPQQVTRESQGANNATAPTSPPTSVAVGLMTVHEGSDDDEYIPPVKRGRPSIPFKRDKKEEPLPDWICSACQASNKNGAYSCQKCFKVFAFGKPPEASAPTQFSVFCGGAAPVSTSNGGNGLFASTSQTVGVTSGGFAFPSNHTTNAPSHPGDRGFEFGRPNNNTTSQPPAGVATFNIVFGQNHQTTTPVRSESSTGASSSKKRRHA